MAFTDSYAAAFNPIVQAQVTMALMSNASTVYSEATTTPGHTVRAAFATKVSTGTVPLQPLIQACCAFASLTASSTDTTVSNAVAALWNMFSGA